MLFFVNGLSEYSVVIKGNDFGYARLGSLLHNQ